MMPEIIGIYPAGTARILRHGRNLDVGIVILRVLDKESGPTNIEGFYLIEQTTEITAEK